LKLSKVLILGASGFIGGTLYKELSRFYNTFGTYCHQVKTYSNNKQFIRFNVEEDDAFEMLNTFQPDLIISALRGPFNSLITAHAHMSEYVLHNPCKLVFISSTNVFDAYSKYPSYEYDKTLSESVYGRFQIKIENSLLRLPKTKVLLVRVPMVFGQRSPRIKDLKIAILERIPIEVFPNLIVNVSSSEKLSKQLLLLINQNASGVYHLGSVDLVPHEDFIQELVRRLRLGNPIYKRIYTTNEDRYLAVLPKENPLDASHNFGYQDCLEDHF
jgi:dTDP-4-dehydrorhamnose reductase